MTTNVYTAAASTLFLAAALLAHAAMQTDIAGPAGSGTFGREVAALPNGNIVVTDPAYDAPGPVADVGAVYLYDGASRALISTMTGTTAGDEVGNGGATVLSNGDYVVTSMFWRKNGMTNVGAVTHCSGTTGCSGTVSAENSLVGSASGDRVGISGITVLSSGRYLVRSPLWANGAAGTAGAVTFCSGTTGCTGEVTATNSLVGSQAFDNVGGVVTVLTNGNYVASSLNWDSPSAANVGAVTFCDGTNGCTGPVTAANSLVGSKASDSVGIGIERLTNGNYVVRSPNWDNGAAADAGAATFGSGTTGISGTISAANSLVGSKTGDFVSSFGDGIIALSNGNYVVLSPNWDKGSLNSVGAATFGNGTTGVSGTISEANSLVGSKAGDLVGLSATPLSNGDYVVASNSWDNGAINSAGAATWCSGMTGCAGAITPENSLVGSTASDFVASGVYALTNGNYVVRSPDWDNGAIAGAGAATWCSSTAPCKGTIAAANSLVGSTAGDRVSFDGVTALSNGNYVVRSNSWDNGAIVDAGAATFGSGTSGITGPVSSSNSLVGSATADFVGGNGVTALSNGNYVVALPGWDKGPVTNAGAATFGNGTSGISGAISAANSLVGSTAEDFVGSSREDLAGVTALSNGDYVVSNGAWNNGAITDAGAITYGIGNGETVGEINSSNSVRGTAANGGSSHTFAFDPVNNQIVVGRPADNLVTLFVYAAPAPSPSPSASPSPTLSPSPQPSPTPVPTASPTPAPSPTPSPSATASPSPQPTASPSASPTPSQPRQLLNIATRLRVQSGENVLIAGVIVTGNDPKKVIIRAIGPSLSEVFDGALRDTTLESYQGDTLLANNDNWKDSQQTEIEATTIPPGHELESAIVYTLAPGFYTAVMSGKDGTTGIGVIEVYDLDQEAESKLANIASRGFVEAGDSVMIGGLIVGGDGTKDASILLRAIGPSLGNAGVADALQDPTLELRDSNGELVRENDNWQDTQQTEIEETTIPPGDPAEAAILAKLPSGNYTAVVRGKNDSTGVGLVEVYNLP